MQQSRNVAGPPPAFEGPLARPLSARSVIASLLLGMHPPRMRGALLVKWCELFGIAEGTTRVALHRMSAAHELQVTEGSYTLAGPLVARQEHQEWSLEPRLGKWTGEWRLAVVGGERRSAPVRQALRTAMRRLRYAERREGLWLRPDNLPDDAAPAEAHAIATAQCSWWTGAPDGDDPAGLAASLFRIPAWMRRATDLTDRLVGETGNLRAGDFSALADAFVVGAAALQQVRADPLLPDELLPAGWPGRDLRVAYAEYRAAFGVAAAAWFRSVRER